MNKMKQNTSACIFGQKNNQFIYAIGGFYKNFLHDIEKYSIN